MRIYPKRPHRPVTPVSRRLAAAFSPCSQADQATKETGHKLTGRRIALLQENQARIDDRIQEVHRKLAMLRERVKKVQNKLDAVRSKTVSIRTVTKIRSGDRDE